MPPEAEPPPCTPDQEHAPPALEVDGLLAVPIDIETLDARVTIDAKARSASAEATLRFVSGSRAGHPIFDLRQNIDGASLNGEAVDPDELDHHDFGGGEGAELRVVEVEVPACSENTLVVHYPLSTPATTRPGDIFYDPTAARVAWDFTLTDIQAANFLEQWFPANLIHDHFATTLDLELTGADVPHRLITNGVVEELAEAHWRVTFPSTFTALSPMLVLLPEDQVEALSTKLDVPGGSPLTLDLYASPELGADLPAVTADIASYVAEFTASTGPYAGGERLTVYLWTDAHGMEYDGGTTTSLEALKHEIFHLWYGRGAKPSRQEDGWIDEAWDTYNTQAGFAFSMKPLAFDDPPYTLDHDNPWSRVTPGLSYVRGGILFAGIASLIGVDALREQMKAFYASHLELDTYTTEDLEKHLYCATGEPQILAGFQRFVRGDPSALELPREDLCP